MTSLRLITPSQEITEFESHLDRLLKTIYDYVGEGTLLLGGSVARGDPIIVCNDSGDWTLASDIDLVLVHASTRPPCDQERLFSAVGAELPTVSLMTLANHEYIRLQTVIGYDLKSTYNHLGGPDIKTDDVVLTPRDGVELVIHGVLRWLRAGFDIISVEGKPPIAQASYIGACYKVMRGLAVFRTGRTTIDPTLHEGSAYTVAERVHRWIRCPNERSNPTDQDFWLLLADAWAQIEFLNGKTDNAVSGSEYDGSTAAAWVAEYQGRAVEMVRRTLKFQEEAGGIGCMIHASLNRAWDSMIRERQVRPSLRPGTYFANLDQAFQNQLLEMKLNDSTARRRIL